MLAVGLGPLQRLTVDQLGPLGEAALRAGDGHRSSAEGRLVLGGEPVQDVAFGHGGSLFCEVL
ncbi:hypothetical protein GCM10010442_59800 [Kitasatospora kifunensis]